MNTIAAFAALAFRRLCFPILVAFAGVAAAGTPLVIPVTPKEKTTESAVRFNAAGLEGLAPGAEVDLVLPDGTRHTYLYEHSVSHGGGFTSWVARSPLTGDNERAIITNGPGGAFGWMKTPHGEYRIYPSNRGYDVVAKSEPMDHSPKDGRDDARISTVRDRPDIEPLKGVPTVLPTLPKVSLWRKATPSPTLQADVMLIYTRDLAQKLGMGLMPMLYNVITTTNQSYIDSEVAISLRLVNATMLDLDNSVSSFDALDGMQNTAGGAGAAMNAVFQPLTWGGAGSVRNIVGADFVALLRDGPNDTGGVAWLEKNPTIYPGVSATNTDAYSVNNYCASGCAGILAHELGHNMGSHHDTATIAYDNKVTATVVATGVFAYSYGHYSCSTGLTCNPYLTEAGGGCLRAPTVGAARPTCVAGNANNFGTVMSYFSPKIMKFSNPALANCVPSGGNAGSPRTCGGPSVTPDPGNSNTDNALSMNNVRGNISAYRTQTITNLPGSVQFTAATFSGSETGGTLTFTVSRASGTSGAISVNYTVSGGTATSGVDFAAASGTLNWADGDGANKTFAVTLVNDAAPEGVETMTATLSNPSGATGVYLGYPSVAAGSIVEAWPTGTLGWLPTLPTNWTSPATPAPSSIGWSIVDDSAPAGDPDGRSLKSGAMNFAVANRVCNDTAYGAVPCPSQTELATTFAAGTVSYAYRVSAYPNGGFFEVFVDNVLVASATGSNANTDADTGWQASSFPISAGAHTIRFQYRPKFYFPCANASGGGPPPYPGCMDRAWIDQVSVPLALAASTTSLGSSLNPSTAGQSVTFTATVGGGATGGTVQFRDGATLIAGCSAIPLAGGSAACSTSALAQGARSITAAYSGTISYATSTSTVLTQTVNAGTTFALIVTKAGTGAGGVTSSPVGIDCGATCAASFASGATITLTATPAGGSVFAGWSGAGCSGTGTCQVTLNSAQAVTATFNIPATNTLTVTRAGSGSGSVSSSPAGISCGATCSASFTTDAVVSLIAVPAVGSEFAGWSGGCSGTGSCQVTMSAARSVTATFTAVQTLTVTKAGTGAGGVTSVPAGIDCGATCSASFSSGTVVTLAAVATGTSAFAGWSGGGCTGVANCQVTMSSAQSVTATFTAPAGTAALTVSKTGTGFGTVTSTPVGINCGATCSASFPLGTPVTLTATPVGGSFGGWSGGGCAGTGTCQVPMDAAKSVVASFPAPASGTAVPSTLLFGGQSMLTTSTALTVTLNNNGGTALTVSGVTTTAGFTQVNDCGTVPAAGFCIATVRFTPAAQGIVNGTLTFQTSGGDVPVPLTGTGERSLVTHYYNAILNRAPDSAGKAFWESEAARLTALGVNINETWFVMAGYFYNSAEYLAANKTNTQFVADLYNTFFNRPPDAGGSAYWVGQITAGLPREVVLFSFMFSTEFRTFTQGIFGNTVARPEVDMVVDFFRGLLNRLPDTASFNFWLGQLRTAQCQGAGPVYTKVDEISAAFMFNAEYNNRARNNTQFATDMYYSFLRRGGDVAGVQYWINQLNIGTPRNNVRFFGFLNGAEFGARVQAVIAAGCLP